MCRYLAGEVIVIRYQHIAGCQSLYSYILTCRPATHPASPLTPPHAPPRHPARPPPHPSRPPPRHVPRPSPTHPPPPPTPPHPTSPRAPLRHPTPSYLTPPTLLGDASRPAESSFRDHTPSLRSVCSEMRHVLQKVVSGLRVARRGLRVKGDRSCARWLRGVPFHEDYFWTKNTRRNDTHNPAQISSVNAQDVGNRSSLPKDVPGGHQNWEVELFDISKTDSTRAHNKAELRFKSHSNHLFQYANNLSIVQERPKTRA